MKVALICVVLLGVLFAVNLAKHRRASSLITATVDGAAQVLPPREIQQMVAETRQRAQKVFEHLPRKIRAKIEAKVRIPALLVLFRLALLRHLLPTLYLPMLIGALEGSWARHNQPAIVKIHSPIVFRTATLALALAPLAAFVWLLAPVAIPASLVLATEFPIIILALRGLILNAPSHF
ncbi:MAG TPA: DUF4400 domain-containing protein [Terriglobia bacterium]|nr:DUF4400 domain-containing protein [Terriglobia bacterium]